MPLPVITPLAQFLGQAFQNPIGLLAGTALPVLIILYLVRPEPEKRTFSSIMFLMEEEVTKKKHGFFKKLLQDPLLLLQLIALLLFTLVLAQPFLEVPQSVAADHTIIILDVSASMQTNDRFSHAVKEAKATLGEENTIILAGDTPTTILEKESRAVTRDTLDTVRVQDTSADIVNAISAAENIARSGDLVVVLSDFATEEAIEQARDRATSIGAAVQFRRVGSEIRNAGIIDLAFKKDVARITVKNFNMEEQNFTLATGTQETSLRLGPGDVRTIPVEDIVGRKVIELSPSDAFPVDNTLFLAGNPPAKMNVALLTNNASFYLRTALAVNGEVSHTVLQPPLTTSLSSYDVVIVGEVDPDKILPGTIRAIRNSAEEQGIVLTASPALPQLDLHSISPVAFRGTIAHGVVQRTPHPLSKNLVFGQNAFFNGTEKNGIVLARSGQTPVIAIDNRVAYYGILEELSTFHLDITYPILWKRILATVADRPSLRERNKKTGAVIELDAAQEVSTPSGERRTRILALEEQGFYQFDGKHIAANLLDERESNPAQKDVARSAVERGKGEGTAQFSLTPFLLLFAAIAVAGELLYLKYRGDI